jgi:hypothetical protein
MTRFAQALTVAEMTGRELARRRLALALLTALPLVFYASSSGEGSHAAQVGAVAMAFSVSGAAIFTALSGRAVDQRLGLAGLRPISLLLGRLLTLAALGAGVAALFTIMLLLGSDIARPWTLVVGVQLVALVGVPFGLALGALAPRELEAVLAMIGVVGVQLSLHGTTTGAKALPFWGPERLVQIAGGDPYDAAPALVVSVVYALALLALAALLNRSQEARS